MVVWLGESSELIEKRMGEMPNLMEKLDSFDGRLGFEPERLVSRQPPAPRSDTWLGIYDLLSRSWFTRVWGFQEAVLAKKIEVMCGRKTVAFEELLAFNDALSKPHAMDFLDWLMKMLGVASRPTINAKTQLKYISRQQSIVWKQSKY